MESVLSLIADEDGGKPLYGAILFTEAHPYLVKVLKDDDLWNALDAISGEAISIFATRLFRGQWTFPSPPPGTLAMMRPVWKEPSANKELLECFGIHNSESPYFVLFGFDGDTLFYESYSLSNDSADVAYTSLEEVVKTISNYIENHPEQGNTLELYKALKLRMKVLKTKSVIKRAFQFLSSFRGAAGV